MTSRQATELNSEPQQLHAQAREALHRSDWWHAGDFAARALALAPRHADAHFVLGVAGLELNRNVIALAHLQEAATIAPHRPDYAAQLARMLARLQRLPEAMAAADRAMTLAPEDAFILDTLGLVYSQANAHSRAATMFGQAVALAPMRAEYRLHLAASLAFIGDNEGAAVQYEACLSIAPDNWRAHTSLSQLRKQTDHHNHVERLEHLLPAAAGNPDALLHVHMALAKEYEDLGNYEKAFEHVLVGKNAWRNTLDYTPERDAALFEALIQAFPEPLTTTDPGADADEPIFIIGMPRSGTTLVERILSSHPQVHSAGELYNFSVALKRASGSSSSSLLDADTIARCDDLDWGKLGAQYLASTRHDTGDKPHFIDKLPHNFLFAGYIAKALPRARIICLRRDPVDTCLSNFRQLFSLQSSVFDYSYDLLDTGRYYLLFDRLMAHWRQVLPGRILEIDYESIVESQRQATERLLAFCGLPWSDACLHFQHNKAPVATASVTQVRAPIYRSSINRWKHYPTQTMQLRQLLQQHSHRMP